MRLDSGYTCLRFMYFFPPMSEFHHCAAGHSSTTCPGDRATPQIPCGTSTDETFRLAPIPILIEDWFGIRQWVDSVRASGVKDLDAYLDHYPEAVDMLRDRYHRFVDANDAALSLFDAESKQIFFGKAKKLLPASRRSNAQVLKAIFNGQSTCQGERTLTSLTGKTVPIVWRCSLPADPERYRRLHFYAFDITEYHENINRLESMRAEIARAGRIALVGQLAASITHEISQPLSATRTSVEAAQRWLNRDQPEVAEALTSIRDAARWARDTTDICHKLRSFMTHTPVQPKLHVAAEVVESAVFLIAPDADAKGIAVEIAVDSKLKVFVDRVQLQQVLGNLLVNGIQAIDSMPVVGTRQLTITAQDDGNDAVIFKVSDTGRGISNQALESLFQPFTTSKPEGMGIGLSISKSIVEAHGGRIWVERGFDKGTTFCFSLPGVRRVQVD